MNLTALHILIVDDSPEDRYTVRRLLRTVPGIAAISEADRGDHALAICQTTTPDCILIDYHLPDMDGIEVLTRLRAQRDVPVVLLTGLGNEALAVDALQCGAQDYLVKATLTSERLRVTIERAVATVQLARERDRTFALLTTMLDTLPLGVAVLDHELRVVQVNRTLSALLGRPALALHAQPLADLWPELVTPLAAHCAYVQATGQPTGPHELVAGLPAALERPRVWQTSAYPLVLPGSGAAGLCLVVQEVTGQRQASAALHASEIRYQTLFETMTQGVVYQAADGQIITCNPAAERILGLSLAQMEGRTSLDPRWRAMHLDGSAFPGETHPAMVALRTGQAVRHVVMGIYDWAHDAYRWINITAVPQVPPGAAAPMFVYTAFDDITERVQAEQAAAEALARLDAIVTNSPNGIGYLNRELRYVLVNPALAAINRHTPAEHFGRTPAELIPGLAPQLEPIMRHVLATGEAVRDLELRQLCSQNDVTHDWLISYFPVPDPAGGVAGVGVSVTDITQSKRTERALQTSTAKLASALENMTDAIFISDLDGRLLDFNLAFATFHKFKTKDECAKTLAEYPAFLEVFLPNGALAPLEQWAVPRALRGETVTNAEYTLRRKDTGATWVGSYSFAPIRDPDGSIIGAVVIGRDITERTRIEQALRDSALQLQALSRRLVEAHERERRHLARELHDEVGQVLTGLKLTLAVATAEAPTALAATLENAQLILTELMGRVRSLSLDLRPALLDDMGLLPALDWYRERYTARTGVQVDLRHQGLNRRFSAEVETVAYRIIQEALTNIARHAGVLTATVRLRADGTHLMLRVADAGRGFDAEATLAARATGGLSGMEERVQLIGGVLTIEAAPGQGTQIIAELPLPTEELR